MKWKKRDGGCCQPSSVTKEEEEEEEEDKWTLWASLPERETEKERESERKKDDTMDQEKMRKKEDTWKTSLPLLILIKSQEEKSRTPEDGATEREREGD